MLPLSEPVSLMMSIDCSCTCVTSLVGAEVKVSSIVSCFSDLAGGGGGLGTFGGGGGGSLLYISARAIWRRMFMASVVSENSTSRLMILPDETAKN